HLYFSGLTVIERVGRNRFGGRRVSRLKQLAVVLNQTGVRSRRVHHRYGVAPVGRAASALLDLLFGLKLPASIRTNLALAAGQLADRPPVLKYLAARLVGAQKLRQHGIPLDAEIGVVLIVPG